ncbi:hypothetical protein K0M31_009832 [Melipona bicolor]|uniref:Uncharacterized protein n=1 Tax=Melipona bicolor TaxID=60889 RepID=A0AA40FML6_9HYME|nr:hypothetical protein K0M31_009832 [Melipona bicolor]
MTFPTKRPTPRQRQTLHDTESNARKLKEDEKQHTRIEQMMVSPVENLLNKIGLDPTTSQLPISQLPTKLQDNKLPDTESNARKLKEDEKQNTRIEQMMTSPVENLTNKTLQRPSCQFLSFQRNV